MKTINTIEDAIRILREPIPYMQPDEDLLKIAEWLEELKTLRVKLEKNSKALEIYKRALHSACYEISGDTTQSLMDYYLQKAREDNNNDT